MHRYTAKCRCCGDVTSVLAANAFQNMRHWFYGWAQSYTDSHGEVLPMVDGGLMIPCRGCRKMVRAARVHGVVKASVKCNAKCVHSKGHSCECSCGGKNHGAGYDAHG